jgi:hypothetical protein
MYSSAQVHPVGSDDVQVEVVTSDGHPVTSRPIRIEELLQQRNHTLDIGEGIALRLEELNAQQNYSDDGDDDDKENAWARDRADESSSDNSEDESTTRRPMADKGSGRGAGAPPGTHATDNWYDVLDALRREQQDVERTTAEVELNRRTPQPGEGRLVTRNPNSVQSTATPLKRFSNLPSTESRSVAGDRPPLPAPGASRHDVWASLAPPKDTVSHNYNVLRYVSYMSALDYRRFRPTALAFHATAFYLNRKDRGQRLLVYGGLSVGARRVEQELYEFSVLTGNWRRMEGRQLAPAGHYGHTLTVVEPLDRVVVVGGIGPGGTAVSSEVKAAWTADPLRAPRYQTLCPLLRRGGMLGCGVTAATCASATTQLGIGTSAVGRSVSHGGATAAASIGFVSLLFDMSLGNLCWRAIQPAQPFPLVYHTAVHFEKEIFVFGGLTEELRVSGQLLAINPETYAVRLIASPGTAAAAAAAALSSARSRRERSGSTKGSTADDEAAGSAMDEEEVAGPGPRFLHSAVRYGPYMIVYGGYNTHNEAQSDCWAFDMVNERWERLRCRGEAAGRAGHECCIVGCRMLVVGGFECSLEEVGSSSASPVTTVMELNLVPTTQGEHLWRSAVKLHPALPPLAFTRCAPCGEDHSFLLFGGLTMPPRRVCAESGGRRSESAVRRARERGGGAAGDSHSDTDSEESQRGEKHERDVTQGKLATRSETVNVGHKGLLRRLLPFDDGLVFTFPVRQSHKKRGEDEPAVNALGVEVDPNELPEHFKTFVRRQEDFVKKKDAAALDTMRKITLEEQEGMEPTLYLSDDEIELLLQRSEDCCVAFAQRYPMSSLPSNVPDREERVHLIEECISESRQVRDVLKSMKGTAPGVTAVKSKSHRKRAGQKFEDYSAAKPFRRVVVMHLIESINSHLARMHRLNKALRTVDWEEKANFLEAVEDMQNSVHAVSRAVNGVMRKYVQHNVESLMKGVDKHKEVMRLLTQVVEKNRHDKIWGVEEARDEARHQHQRGKGTSSAARSASPKGHPNSSTRSSSGKAPAATGRGSHRHTSRTLSLGGGYHADESKAVVYLAEKEWRELLLRTQAVEKCAGQLQQYCKDGMATASTVAAVAPAGVATTPAAAGAAPSGNGPLSLPVPQVEASAASTAPSPSPPLPPPSLPLQPPQLATGLQASSAPLDLHVPPPLLVPPAAPPPPPAAPAAEPAVAAAAQTVVGAARPRDVLIRHSNELRSATVTVAGEVAAAAATLHAALMSDESGKSTGQKSDPASSSSSSAATPLGAKQTAAGDGTLPSAALLLVPQPAAPVTTVAGEHAGKPAGASLNTSRSSSSPSTSSGSGSSAGTPQTDPAAPAQSVAPPPLPSVPAVGVPPPVTAGVEPSAKTDAAVAVQHATRMSCPPAERKVSKEVEQKDKETDVAARHAVFLSSLRPLLAAKESLVAFKDQVPLIRKNDWDGNDLAGAPQDSRVEELYCRLEKLITAVAQSVTASFLTKAGARPPRVRPANTSVVPPASQRRATSQKPKKMAVLGSTRPTPQHAAAVIAGVQGGPSATPQLELSVAASAKQEEVSSCNNNGADDAGDLAGAGGVLRLKPLAPTACEDDWWKTSTASPGTDAKTSVGEAAHPLVPTDALLREVRLDNAGVSSNEATKVTIQPVFHDTRTVPNRTATTVGGTEGVAATWATGGLSSAFRFGISVGGTVQQASAVTLSVAPKVVMPPSADTENGREGSQANHTCVGCAAPPASSPQPRRQSLIEELTQLPSAELPVYAGERSASGGGALDMGVGAVTREPITSITGGNFAVNTEYLYRVAPHTIPVGLLTTGMDALSKANVSTDPVQGSLADGRHAWADVDDDYFYFGRPVENRVATADAVVSGPPYVTVAPLLSTGRARQSPPVGSFVGAQRLNAELATTRTSSATRRSVSGRRGKDGYRLTTASQSQKTQTARPVRKDGSNTKSFYTPGELQLMQARERLRSKPQKS